MSNHPDSLPACDASRSQQYLDSAIRTASPARLRLMLIQRSIEVAALLSEMWQAGKQPGSNEYSLKLLDLLNELLQGVKGGNTEGESQVCQQVADLYVFLIQHLVAAEAHSHAAAIDEIRVVLEVEAQTWQEVCANEATASLPAQFGAIGIQTDSTTPSGGLSFEA